MSSLPLFLRAGEAPTCVRGLTVLLCAPLGVSVRCHSEHLGSPTQLELTAPTLGNLLLAPLPVPSLGPTRKEFTSPFQGNFC